MRGLWGGKSGDSDSTSDGQKFQCDCSVKGCPCSRWGYWVPAGRAIPHEVRCDQCQGGKHTG